jgi:hypothetical protein
LDQFLEGIYDFYGENENKIVRIGGRSKSEKLKECNLRAIKEKSEKKAPRYVGRSIAGVHSRLRGVKSKELQLACLHCFYNLELSFFAGNSFSIEFMRRNVRTLDSLRVVYSFRSTRG